MAKFQRHEERSLVLMHAPYRSWNCVNESGFRDRRSERVYIAVGTLALVCAGDSLALRIKMAGKNSSAASGVVQMPTTYAIAPEDGTAEIVFGDPGN
ncbi:MAG: hypothetical protein WA755_08405 [Candidatus Acidiferrales bacterium]